MFKHPNLHIYFLFLLFSTKKHCFLQPPEKNIYGVRLCMTAAESWYSRHVSPLFIFLDNNSETPEHTHIFLRILE